MTQEPTIAVEHAGAAIQLCALANLQAALALPLLAVRRASHLDAERLLKEVVAHIEGALATFEAHRREPTAIDTAEKALAQDTVDYSVNELTAIRDQVRSARSTFGAQRALRMLPRRLAHRVEVVLRTLPSDTPLRDIAWTPALETAAAMPSAQFVHYLALTPAGLVVRETLHQASASASG